MTDPDPDPATSDDADWERPDFCPFCGTALTNGGPGFMDHLEETPGCRERFASWRDRIVDDIGGEWGG